MCRQCPATSCVSERRKNHPLTRSSGLSANSWMPGCGHSFTVGLEIPDNVRDTVKPHGLRIGDLDTKFLFDGDEQIEQIERIEAKHAPRCVGHDCLRTLVGDAGHYPSHPLL